MLILIDLAIVAYIIYKMVVCSWRGFIYTVVSLATTIGTWLISWYYSPILAKGIYTSTLRDYLLGKVSENADYFITTSLDSFVISLEEFFESLPPVLSGVLASGAEKYGESYFSQIEGLAPNSTILASSIMESLIDPLVTGMIRGVCFIAIFIGISFIMRFILPMFKGFNYIPLIGSLNGFLGGISGFILGIVNVYIMTAVLWLASTLLGGVIPFLSQSAIEKTILLRVFFDTLPWV